MEKKSLNAQDYINTAFQNSHFIDQLWCDEEKISIILSNAIKGCSVNDNNPQSICCDYFIDYICVSLIKKPSDFLYIFKDFQEAEDKITLMNLYFQNYLTNPIITNALLDNHSVIEQIGDYHYWIEYPLKFRATKLIQKAPLASLTLQDLFPTELPLPEDIKDYLLSCAYAENKLAETEIDYFQQNFSRSYEMLTQTKQRKE